jgi:lipopolysaccharide transport protein LptA
LRIAAGRLNYYERDQRIDLLDGASLERGAEQLRAVEAHVFLKDGVIRRVTAVDGEGVNEQPQRRISVRAREMDAVYNEHRALEQLIGRHEAVMSSTTPSSTIRTSGRQIDLHYVTPNGSPHSVLREAHVREEACLDFVPRDDGSEARGERRLTAGWIQLIMRGNGEQVERLETLTRGKLELISRNEVEPRRTLEAERIRALYGEENRMERLEAQGAVILKTMPANGARDSSGGSWETLSQQLTANFDPASGEMNTLRQWENFRLERGLQRGQAFEAVFDPRGNMVKLKNRAVIWDETSRVTADSIQLDQASGDLFAEGNVSSVYREEQGGAPRQDGLFAASEPLFGTADRMWFRREVEQIEYEGSARLWQEEDRIEANRIAIDQAAQTLEARGKVFTMLSGGNSAPAPGGGGPRQAAEAPASLYVWADELSYRESDRTAGYRRDVRLRRRGLTVEADQLQAWLHAAAQSGEAGRLRKATAQGSVRLREEGDVNSRKAFGQKAEYEPADEVVRLWGEPARLLNAAGSETRGSALTYSLDDDRLLVLGDPAARAYSLRRASP